MLTIPLAFLLLSHAPTNVVPIEMRGGHIYLPVTVNGKKAEFILDTGAQTSCVKKDSQARLGIKTGRPVKARGAGGGTMDAWLTELDSINVGGLELKKMQTAMLELPSGLDGDGILGYTFMKDYVVSIDYQALTIRFDRPAEFTAPTASESLPVKFVNGIPSVEVTIDDIKGWATLDSGASGTVTLNAPFVKANELKAKHPKRVPAVVGKGVGGYVRGDIFRLEKFSVGPYIMPTFVAAMANDEGGVFSENDRIANIGTDVLSRFKISFDYPGKRIVLVKSDRFDAPSESNRAGMFVDFDGKDYVLADVAAGSPAASAGMEAGDTILFLDDVPAARLPKAKIRESIRGKAGTVLKFRVKKKSGDQVEVQVELKDWI